MSEEKVKSRIDTLREQFGDDIYTKTKWEGRQSDWLIQWFVDFVNEADASFPMTFTVGGNLVSGYLISESVYFDQLAVDFSVSVGEQAKDAAQKLILALKPLPLAEGDEKAPDQFVHLKSAQVFTEAGKPIVSGGALWRGKISSIEGFHLGSLRVS